MARAVNVSGRCQTAVMSTPFDSDSPHRRALASLVAGAESLEREIRVLQGRQLRALAEAERLATAEADRLPGTDRSLGLPQRVVGIEVGWALDVSDLAARRRVDHAADLFEKYADVASALVEGAVSVEHTRAIVVSGIVIESDAARAGYEAEILPIARTATVGKTWSDAKVLAEKYADRDLEARMAEEIAFRGVRVVDLGDGVAEVRAVMEAPFAYAIKDRLHRQAKAVQDQERAALFEAKRAWREQRAERAERAGHGEDAGGAGADTGADDAAPALPAVRPLSQIRADLVTDMLLNADPIAEAGDIDLSKIQARVQVTVPVLSLLPKAGGLDLESSAASEHRPAGEHSDPDARRSYLGVAGLQGAAMLAGYGPISAHTARLLAGLQAGWDRISCHPMTGQVLEVDRYRPSEGMKRFIAARDQHCRAPGCAVVPHRADIDHVVDSACGGATSTTNLAAECRFHHVNKHHTGLRMTLHPDGAITWVTPLGATIREEPPSRVMFRPRLHDAGESSARRGGRAGWRSPGTGPLSEKPPRGRLASGRPPERFGGERASRVRFVEASGANRTAQNPPGIGEDAIPF